MPDNTTTQTTAVFAPTSVGLLAPLKPWLTDNTVSEILINKPQELYVEAGGKLTCHPIPELTKNRLATLFQLIANENEQTLSVQNPLLSGSLQDGSRIQLVIPPVAKHHTLSIRRKVIHEVSLDGYQQMDFYSKAKAFNTKKKKNVTDLPESEQQLIHLYQQGEWHQFIQQAIALKKTIVISGGTSSGKTTYLNACLRHIPLKERIITLEDTREISIPHPNQVNLLASKGGQGRAKVTPQDLVQCCLRLRPDRIICGEIRGKEILDFISACSTGHEGSFTTLHASNPQIAFMRMAQMVKLNNVPSMTEADIERELKTVIDIIVQLEKTDEGRKVQSVYYRNGE